MRAPNASLKTKISSHFDIESIRADFPILDIKVEGIDAQIRQVFANLQAVTAASGGDLGDIVKLNIFLTDLENFALVNEIMAKHFVQPYPARAAVGVKALPRGALVEMDAIMIVQG